MPAEKNHSVIITSVLFISPVNPSFYVLTNDAKPTEPRTYRTYYKNPMKESDMPVMGVNQKTHE